MPWDDTARKQHSRDGLRYPSDLTDREWCLSNRSSSSEARRPPRTTDLRAVTEAVLYIASSGCQWRMLPKDFPPVSTVRGYFYAWRDAGLWQTINHLLVRARGTGGARGQPHGGRDRPQSVKTTESGGFAVTTRARSQGRGHMITDNRLMLFTVIHAADIQDRDGAPEVLKAIRHRFPGSAMSSPTGFAGQSCEPHSRARATGPSRSSSARTRQKASRSSRDAGL